MSDPERGQAGGQGAGKTNQLSRNQKQMQAKTEANTRGRQTSISQAKDRAQMTANGAMSIVNVALLKSVLDRGPLGNPYYSTSVALIVLSLGLQIIAGVLSIWIANLMSYADKYKSNVCEDFLYNICPCMCRKSVQKIKEDVATEPKIGSINRGFDGKSILGEPKAIEDLSKTLDDPGIFNHEDGCGCCGYVCTTQVYEPSEYVILKKYEAMTETMMKSAMMAIKTKDEMEYQIDLVQNATLNVTKYSAILADSKSSDEEKQRATKKLEETRIRLEEGEDNKRIFEEKLRQLAVIFDQASAIEDWADTVRKNKVMKLLSFWQDILNYIFYIVFVINAVITGFGIATPASAAPGSILVSHSNTTTLAVQG